ncbi:4'-phosphopantetheinyl transferase family protein [Streptodolium elevatio]|uniref:4'-phosphopantetheinyl transferase superfamily protein n=1 Tax=Streptodolium elevatio TaxID=3157996 RepID=A0ABV3DKY3_9ACTN
MTGGAESWLIDLHGADDVWDDAACRGDLSPEESRRAARLRPASAVTYVRSRSAVRRVLAHVLGGSPADLPVAAAPNGRPVLPNHPGMHVSWSRSAGVLLVAMSRGGPVGADVEAVRPVKSPGRVLRTFYPDTAALGDIDDPEVFLSAWTLLEAAVKATGRGLAKGAGDVRLHRPPGARHCALLGIGAGTGGAREWSARTDRFTPPRSSVPVITAVVVRGAATPDRPHTWRFPGTATAATPQPRRPRPLASRRGHVGAGSDAEPNRPTLGRLEIAQC